MTEQKRDDQGQFAASASWLGALFTGTEPATDPPADTPTAAATEPNPDPTAAWLDALTCPNCHSRRNPSPHITHTEKGQRR